MYSNYNNRKRKLNNDNKYKNKIIVQDSNYVLINKVKSQTGVRGKLVLLHSPDDNVYSTLVNAASEIECLIQVIQDAELLKKNISQWILKIGKEVLASGSYDTQSIAKSELSQQVFKSLQKTCFTIVKKVWLAESTKISIPVASNASTAESSTNANQSLGGIGARMMKQMGWSGGGLGAQEQGRLDIVQSYEQVNRQGLGSKNIYPQITKILRDFAFSRSLNSLAFSSEFSPTERAQIHAIARKQNLKSKSYGQGEDRTLVVSCKMTRWDMVERLLELNRENDQYHLLIPTDFNDDLSSEHEPK